MPGIAETQELVARLRLDASQYEAALGQVGAKTAAFERQINSIGQSINRAVGSQTAALRAQAAEMERIAAQSTLVGSGGMGPISPQAKAAAAAQAAALRAEAQLIEDNAAAGTLAYERRAAAAIEAARVEAKAALDAANASKASLAERARLQKAYDEQVIAGARARAAAEVRFQEIQAANAAKLRKNLEGIGSATKKIGLDAARGGLNFLQNTVLATAAAGGVLELQFLRVQESQAALARTLHGESLPSIDRLNEEILELSKTIPVATTELFRIAEVIGTTNVAADSIDDLTKVVAQLSATTDLTADEAAISMSRLLKIFGDIDSEGHIAAGAAESLADAIFRASLQFSSTDQEIIKAALRFGALAESMKLTQGQVLALAGATTGLGQQPEAVGGSFQRVFQIINKAVGNYDESIKRAKASGDDLFASEFVTKMANSPAGRFAELAGLSAAQFSEGIKTAPFETFIKLIEGFSALSPTEQAQLFGEGGIFPAFVRGAQTLQNLGLVYEDVLASSREFDQSTGAFAEAFETRTDTLAKKLQLLVNAFTIGAVAFGEAFDEELGGAIQRVTDYILENEDAFRRWGNSVGRAIREINWDQVKRFAEDFFDIFATGVSTVGDVLDFIGPKVTAQLALLKVVDTLSGGLFSKAAIALGSGVLKVIIDKTIVQPVFVTNPGFGTGGPGVVGKGGVVGLLATLSTFAVAAVVSYGIVALLRPVLESVVPKEFLAPGGKTQGQEAQERGRRATSPTAQADRRGAFFDPQDVKEVFGPTLEELGALIPTSGFGSDLAARADAQRRASLQYEASMRDDLAIIAANTDSSTGLLEKMLEALKPSHRRGEVGKSIETTQGRQLKNLSLDDPNFTSKLTAYTAALVQHYTKDPIGSPGHQRGFVLGNVNPIERNLGSLLRQAVKDGNVPAQDLLVQQLEALDSIPKNDLSPKIERLIETVRRKRLAVSFRTGPTRVQVRQGAFNVRVYSTIGKRTVARAVYTGGGYGPAFVYGGTRLYEGGPSDDGS